MPRSTNDTFSPEMIKILKIFGLGSLFLVLLLSFFNEKRARNSGEEIMSITSSSRLYFKNIRMAYYDAEGRADAKMNIYRYGKRVQSKEKPLLNLSIIINRVKDEAYIYLEPNELLASASPLRLQWRDAMIQEEGELVFYNGDKFAHYHFVEELYLLVLNNAYVEVEIEGIWHEILQTQEERDAFRITCADYFRLIENPK
jgi:hypothetical protein